MQKNHLTGIQSLQKDVSRYHTGNRSAERERERRAQKRNAFRTLICSIGTWPSPFTNCHPTREGEGGQSRSCHSVKIVVLRRSGDETNVVRSRVLTQIPCCNATRLSSPKHQKLNWHIDGRDRCYSYQQIKHTLGLKSRRWESKKKKKKELLQHESPRVQIKIGYS
jgi:hypothetical protein